VRAELPVVVAARDLDAFTVVRAGDVEVVTSRTDTAPRNALPDPLAVVGRVLAEPMVAAQPFVPDLFVEDGSALHLARSLGPGQRAMSLTLDDGAGLDPLLYPGSVVDVLATFVREDGDPVTITLLESIRVLAIGTRTVVDPFAGGRTRLVDRARPTVSLLVDGEQAAKLKLAKEEGRLSLTLRDPEDETLAATPGAQTGLAQLSPALAPPPDPGPDPSPPAPPEVAATPPPRELVILRGSERETKTFPTTETRR